jgi:serine/threonine protein kinase
MMRSNYRRREEMIQKKDDKKKKKGYTGKIGFHDLEKIDYIGEGGYGKVSLVQNSLSGRIYVLKRLIPKESEDSESSVEKRMHMEEAKKGAQREIEMMKVLGGHPKIVRLVQTFRSHPEFILLEPVMGGDLEFHLAQRGGRFSVDQVQLYSAEIIAALWFMHDSKHVVWRDLKLSNILLTRQGSCKIADFGLAKHLGKEEEKTLTLCGTPQYMSPEMFKFRGYGFSVDWWALGIVVHTMAFGFAPFGRPQRWYMLDSGGQRRSRSRSGVVRNPRGSSSEDSEDESEDDSEDESEEEDGDSDDSEDDPLRGSDQLKDVVKDQGIFRKAYPNFVDFESESFCPRDLALFIKNLLQPNPGKRVGCSAAKRHSSVTAQKFFNEFNWRALSLGRVKPLFVPEVRSQFDMSNFDAIEGSDSE